MPEVQWAIRIRQGGGDEDSARRAGHTLSRVRELKKARVYLIDATVSFTTGYTRAPRKTALESPLAQHPQCIVAISSGKGGVGKSTVAMNLARALQVQGLSVGLLDADVYGPSQRCLLGIPEGTTPEQVGEKYLRPIDVDGIRAMSMAFLTSERTPVVWRGPMASGALIQMLEQTQWGDLDILLVDMPPGTGDMQLTLAQRTALTGAVIVTTPQDVALLDARKGIEMFAKVGVPVLGVVENMAMHTCSACGHQEAVFGTGGGDALAGDYNTEVLARLPLDIQVRELADRGKSVVTELPESAAASTFLAAAQALREVLKSHRAPSAPIISMGDD